MKLSKRKLIYAIPAPLRSFGVKRVLPHFPHSLRNRVSESIRIKKSSKAREAAQPIEDRLWCGFSAYALPELEALKRDPGSSRKEAQSAAEALARWHMSCGDFEKARENLVVARLARSSRRSPIISMMEAECLTHLGHLEKAREILLPLVEQNPTADLCGALANTYVDDKSMPQGERDAIRLELINRPLIAAGVAPLAKRDAAGPLSIGNVVVPTAQAAVGCKQGPKISVLLPAHNASSTLHLAMDSLLAQTWQNLELILVDDCSTDDTYAVAQGYAARDDRVRVLQHETNGGAYVARNTALAAASGEYVTVHDTDDWSHPQKIELQLKDLLAEKRVANLTDWVRCWEDFTFRPPARVQKTRVIVNSSSLLIKRELLSSLGGWDKVRVAGDTELIHRLAREYGPIKRLHMRTPLAYALERPSSLTRQSVTHVTTKFHGVRRTYHEAAEHWSRSQVPPIALPPGPERPFPAPNFILPNKQVLTELDVLVVMDMRLRGGSYVSTFNYIEAAIKMGLRVGVFHWRRYDLNPLNEPSEHFLEAVQEGKVYRVSPGEKVKVSTVLVGYPVILQYMMDLPPEVECQRLGLIVNQMYARLYSGGDVQYDPHVVAEHAERVFGRAPRWIPISDLVRGLMEKDGRYQPIHSKTWNPLINAEGWLQVKRNWRGGSGVQPAVGRHARDHYTKWPTEQQNIRDAYLVDRPASVRLLGGATVPTQLLGAEPANWTVYPFGTLEPADFLDTLDFYVHYPHDDYIEEFGRAVLEAMAAGVPVILPPVFRPTFGDAALYAEPDQVWPLVSRIWGDEKQWLERVEVGRNFVRVGCGWERFEERLNDFIAES